MTDPQTSASPAITGRLGIGPADLDGAVAAGVVTRHQADALWTYWQARAPAAGPAYAVEGVRFSFGHTLYYFGGLLAIGAMSLFMTLSWDAIGPWGVCILAVLYGAGCWVAAEILLRRGLPIPAGLLGALAVCLVPLATWSAQNALGLWPDEPGAISGHTYNQYHQYIDARWLTLEVATLLAGGIMLWRLRLPFMVMPLAVTLWYMSMDLSRLFLHQRDDWDWHTVRGVSLVFGVAMCVLAGIVDVRGRRRGTADFAAWLYLFGAITAWSGLTLTDAGNEWARLAYAVFNAGLVLFGAIIGRRIFTILGAFGVAAYLGYLAFQLFEGSLLFPLALSVLGLGLVAVGIWWQRREAAIHAKIAALLPAGWGGSEKRA